MTPDLTTPRDDYLNPYRFPGGSVIVDDYVWVPNCRRAVEDYRAQHGITEEIRAIDQRGVFWRRSAAAPSTE